MNSIELKEGSFHNDVQGTSTIGTNSPLAHSPLAVVYTIKRKENPTSGEDSQEETNNLKGPNDAPYVGHDLGGAILEVTKKFALNGAKGMKTPNS